MPDFSHMSARQFSEHVASLPAPDYSHDDGDPNWVRPTTEFGQHPVEVDEHRAMADAFLTNFHPQRKPPPLQTVPLDQVRHTQTSLNLEAVHHYVDKPHELYDPDGWLGTDHPVAFRHPQHGVVLMDGNSRAMAARIRGDRTFDAHVIPGNPAPHHVAAIREYERTTHEAIQDHGDRMDALRAEHGPVVFGPNAHPAARRASAESARLMTSATDAATARLRAKLSR